MWWVQSSATMQQQAATALPGCPLSVRTMSKLQVLQLSGEQAQERSSALSVSAVNAAAALRLQTQLRCVSMLISNAAASAFASGWFASCFDKFSFDKCFVLLAGLHA